MIRALTAEHLYYLVGKLPYEFGNIEGSITKNILYHSIFPENSNHDSHWRREAENPGSAAGQPWGAPGQCRAVPPYTVLHQRALSSAPPLGVQNGLWNYRKGKHLGREAASPMSPELRTFIFLTVNIVKYHSWDRVWRVRVWSCWGRVYTEWWAAYQWGLFSSVCLAPASDTWLFKKKQQSNVFLTLYAHCRKFRQYRKTQYGKWLAILLADDGHLTAIDCGNQQVTGSLWESITVENPRWTDCKRLRGE